MFRTTNYGSRLAKKINSRPKMILTALVVAALACAASFAASAAADSSRSSRAEAAAGEAASALGAALSGTNASLAAPFFTVFSNPAAITIGPNAGAASPYPSNIVVSGMSGTITDVNVTITGLSHADQQDVDIMLVAPNGDALILMSDTGQSGVAGSVTLTFDDAAAAGLPHDGSAPVVSGTFKPTDRDGSAGTVEDTAFPPPAPATPNEPQPAGSATLNSVFGGDTANGTWSLYVVDDANTSGGSISGGWSIDITVAASAVATTTTVSGSPNPALTNQNITITANVASTSTVNEGTVTFTRNGVNLSCTGGQPRPVSSGTATCTIAASSLGEGTHTITATYNGTANFATSNGNYAQEVNNPTTVTGNEFCNTGTINIPVTGATTPYPSKIFVSGLTGTISKVTVDLKNLSHVNPDDLDILLVGPLGQKVVLMSDAGGTADATNVNVIFDDAFPLIPDAGPLVSGTYAPSDYAPADTFPAPAPAGPYGALLSAYNGTNPNGTWTLYVHDDGSGADSGQIAGGWCLDFTTTNDAPTTTTLTSAPNPSLTTQNVVFTATVVKTSDSSPVTSGTVIFREGATQLTCTEGAQPRPLNGSGQATCTVAAGGLSEGDHTISADYSGSPGLFNTSSDDHLHIVNSPTVVTGTEFCNNGVIAIPAPSPSPAPAPAKARPYPSNITVSGLPSTILKVTVEINDLTHTEPDDVDLMLVGPGGQSVILMSDAGGSTDVTNVDLTFDDAAAGPPSDAGPLVSGTYTISNHTAVDSDAFPPPAPAGPHGSALSVYNSVNPNGTWQLYVIDDGGGNVGQIGGWCLNFSLPVNINISDAVATEPASGSTNMVFTVSLSQAVGQTVSVNFTTNVGGANPATPGSDYTTTNGTVTFQPGETLQTINVPVLADADNSETDETFLVDLSAAVNGTISDGQATGTIKVPGTGPGGVPGALVITELRTSGPGGTADDFVEIYNNSNVGHTVAASDSSGGYGLFKMNSVCTSGVGQNATPVLVGVIPNGTTIPARGHFLFTATGYTLGGAAAGDLSGVADIENDRNVGLFSTADIAAISSLNRFDAVGFGLNMGGVCDLLREGSNEEAAQGSTSEYSFVRWLGTPTGYPQDTNSNQSDFIMVSTTPATPVGTYTLPILGAPGPDNLASPLLRNHPVITSALFDPLAPSTGGANRQRQTCPGAPSCDPATATFGTLTIRRNFINNTGAPVTRLRFRIVNITTLNMPNQFGGAGQADLRALNSPDEMVTVTGGGSVLARGTTIETPPSQPLGGGQNSSYALTSGIITMATPLPAGQGVGVQFRLGVVTNGKFNFFINIEALP